MEVVRYRAPRRDVSMSRSPRTAEPCTSNRLRKVAGHKSVSEVANLPDIAIKVMINVANPDRAFNVSMLPT